ncbi:hypothetical protein CAPTEDRAFT_163254 [Capitella teleta]|uniref:Evolutionarily conserved signaling intermediate in Toll pathway, mitochondrial n=1 Tax=Capitella teleta TaxID=283909 RepID=R7UQ55_CAPTE|nr:hypothetical protein CAPTEDRAFT_163254 [Capitella teleta]|eukprot:ELU08340.1 hypothetical protein CAPTEDRAFT_163254 [Capitella teleta]
MASLQLRRCLLCFSRPASPFSRAVHTSPRLLHLMDARDPNQEKKEKKLIVHHAKQYFDEMAQKARDKKTFIAAVSKYLDHENVYRRGHVEFVYASLEKMKEFNVHRDLETYKKILDLFPKEKLKPQSSWQAELMHYPKQQQCAIDLLEHMEENGVIPDDDMGYALINIFSQRSHVFRRYQRMMYWLPKFKHQNPYPVPRDLPNDNVELAKLALARMAVDLENEISVFQTDDLESAADKTFIVSAQSQTQRDLITSLPKGQSVTVEGGFITYLRYKSFIYFVLKAEKTKKAKDFENITGKRKDNASTFWNYFEDEQPSELAIRPSVHEQEDGTVLAMCITGTSSKDSLASWLKYLEVENPNLSNTPVVFLLKSPTEGKQNYAEEEDEEEEEVKRLEEARKTISDG